MGDSAPCRTEKCPPLRSRVIKKKPGEKRKPKESALFDLLGKEYEITFKK